jgi:hypothetical protein
MTKTNTWSIPHTDIPKQHPIDPARRQASTKKQPKPVPTKRTPFPKPASVSTEAEETASTYAPPGSAESPVANGEVTPNTKPSASHGFGVASKQEAKVDDTKNSKPSVKSSLFNMKNLETVAPFTVTNSGGINDMKDLNSTLPFDSMPAEPTSGNISIRPRDLDLPKPPKIPAPPKFSPVAPGEFVLPRTEWDQYSLEMGAYMYEWNNFNRKMMNHFAARQALVETGLSPNWMRAAGDTGRLTIGADTDAPDDNEQLVLGKGNGGFAAYLRGVEEDFVVREHWSVAWERHRECILQLGQIRDWIRKVGKVV